MVIMWCEFVSHVVSMDTFLLASSDWSLYVRSYINRYTTGSLAEFETKC